MPWTDVRSAGMTVLRRLRAAAGGTAVVLTYHRIADDDCDLAGTAVSPGRFAEQIAAFAGTYELLSAGDLMRRLEARSPLPRRGLCITIDDGYADTLGAALPVLSRHAVPATVFVCSGYLDGTREFWWDELERLVNAGLGAQRRATVRVGDTSVTAGPTADGASLFARLSALIEPLSPVEREDVLSQLREQAGQDRLVRAEKRPLSATELVELAGSAVIEIGAHTVNHVRLASRPLDEQREEISGSRRRLQDVLGASIDTFCYPYGTPGSFSADTTRLVREAGFLGAVTTGLGTGLPWGSVGVRSDRFALPRTATADVSAAAATALIDKRLGSAG
jgi:peptidoglycan/xylan/chitin deacetylase (PgdA/CDA1 family)